jgi:aromatic ring-opening dioxygenase catalytic subunit (LigB family)
VVSAHWEQPVPSLMTGESPGLYYDYYNFPPESYEIKWPSPGAPKLAARVRSLVEDAGFASAGNSQRGFDHGAFIPLKLSFPDADVPTTQLSILKSLNPEEHIRLGAALAPLRNEEVLILCSGMSFHDLRGFFNDYGATVSKPFDAWLQKIAVEPVEQCNVQLKDWQKAPCAKQAHPREEHLLPLMVAAGAAGSDLGKVDYSNTYGGARITSIRFG